MGGIVYIHSQPAYPPEAHLTRCLVRAVALLAIVCLLPSSAGAQAAGKPSSSSKPNELDAFMEKVLKRRDLNRQVLEQYVLDEHEQFEVLGPSRMPVYRQRREFTWYVRDGLHVRSPVRFDGVNVGDDARTEYEDNWSKRERRRLENEKKKDEKDRTKNPPAEPEPPIDEPIGPGGAAPIPTPRFVSEAYFMDFKFEPGNYYLAGREQLEGKNVLRIEYYPTNLFNDDNDRDPERAKRRRDNRSDREKRTEERIDRQMNKTALVTLWVDPAEHQIVKYTFENVWMDFLPAKWLVRIDDIKASMTMGQPFPDVWLPREMNIHAGVTIAAGPLEAAYERRFANYKLAETKTLIRVPKRDDKNEQDDEIFFPEPDQEPQSPPQSEVISEIRVHGNAYLKDEEVIRLAGIAVGQALAADGVRQVQQRLEKSGYFESVEIKKLYRSIDGTSDMAIVLLVHERDGQTTELAGDGPSATPWKRLKNRLMFLPIVDYADGYGLTYGGRVSTVDLFGIGERVSVPLTWGGTRRATVEVERTFKRGPLTRVQSTFGITQRENPRFEIDDQRVAWTARAERSVAGLIRAGVETSQSTVEFDTFDDRLWTVGTDIALDTRGDPAFPRHAVFLSTGWTALDIRGLDGRINRYNTDARGYLGVIKQAVLAGRVQYQTADRTLPPYERLLLGGASNLRGFGTGTYDGDRLLGISTELRVPITSVLSGAKLGVTAFMDAGKVLDVNQRLSDAAWHRGVGGGVFMIATIVRINLDVAHGLKDGKTRVHLSAGFNF